MKLLPALALVPLLTLHPLPAMAQTGGAACATIEADGDRLACYDDIFRLVPDADGALSVTLQSEQLIPARPSGREPATMTVSCAAGNLAVTFAFAGNTLSALGNDAGLTLQYDLQAARSRTLPVDSSNTSIIIAGLDARNFLDGLAGATNLTTRVTPVNSRSLSVRFRVDSFIAQTEPVIAACS